MASFHIVKLPASCAPLRNPADSREPLLPGILGEIVNNHECELNINGKQMPLIPWWTVACLFPLLNLLLLHRPRAAGQVFRWKHS